MAMTLNEAIELTTASLCEYGQRYKHWSIAYSGGKDSSATVTLIMHLIEAGKVPAPETLTVLYADTRQELPPLHQAALATLKIVKSKGAITHVLLPNFDHRFWVYILGWGVPPPTVQFRWCTNKLKIVPMQTQLESMAENSGHKFLQVTGMRLGESAARDARIVAACKKEDGECGQGFFQKMQSDAISDTLAPLVHWRACHIWDWLMFHAPALGFPTVDIADIYGIDAEETELRELSARTGCIECDLIGEDKSLLRLLSFPRWQHMQPLTELRSIKLWLREPQNRLRRSLELTNKSGEISKRAGQLGAIILSARLEALEKVLDIQRRVNARRPSGQPEIILIDGAEEKYIRQLITDKKYPRGWTGNEDNGGLLAHMTPTDIQTFIQIQALQRAQQAYTTVDWKSLQTVADAMLQMQKKDESN